MGFVSVIHTPTPWLMHTHTHVVTCSQIHTLGTHTYWLITPHGARPTLNTSLVYTFVSISPPPLPSIPQLFFKFFFSPPSENLMTNKSVHIHTHTTTTSFRCIEIKPVRVHVDACTCICVHTHTHNWYIRPARTTPPQCCALMIITIT